MSGSDAGAVQPHASMLGSGNKVTSGDVYSCQFLLVSVRIVGQTDIQHVAHQYTLFPLINSSDAVTLTLIGIGIVWAVVLAIVFRYMVAGAWTSLAHVLLRQHWIVPAIRYTTRYICGGCGEKLASKPDPGDKCLHCDCTFTGELELLRQWSSRPRPRLVLDEIRPIRDLVGDPKVRDPIRQRVLASLVRAGDKEAQVNQWIEGWLEGSDDPLIEGRFRSELGKDVDALRERRLRGHRWLGIIGLVGLLSLVAWALIYVVADPLFTRDRIGKAIQLALQGAGGAAILFALLFLVFNWVVNTLHAHKLFPSRIKALSILLCFGVASIGSLQFLIWAFDTIPLIYHVLLIIILNLLAAVIIVLWMDRPFLNRLRDYADKLMPEQQEMAAWLNHLGQLYEQQKPRAQALNKPAPNSPSHAGQPSSAVSQENIYAQQEILMAYRRTLAIYLQQQATLGSAYAPPGVANGIREARDGIRRVKVTLRGWGMAIEDHPDDEETA